MNDKSPSLPPSLLPLPLLKMPYHSLRYQRQGRTVVRWDRQHPHVKLIDEVGDLGRDGGREGGREGGRGGDDGGETEMQHYLPVSIPPSLFLISHTNLFPLLHCFICDSSVHALFLSPSLPPSLPSFLPTCGPSVHPLPSNPGKYKTSPRFSMPEEEMEGEGGREEGVVVWL